MLITNLSGQPKKVCAIFILAAAFCAGLWPLAGSAQVAPGGPTVTTDQTNYPSLSYVTITGAGFAPGETVSNVVVQTSGPTPGQAYPYWEVVADTNGNISTTWYIFSTALGGATFQLSSTGETSGLGAQTSFSDSDTPSGPTVTTDQADYPPGSTVFITGAGFAAGETVHCQVLHVPGTADNLTSPAHQPWTATADASGNLSTSWYIPLDEDELNATLQLTAIGQTSGLTAQVTFTDGTKLTFTSIPSTACTGAGFSVIIENDQGNTPSPVGQNTVVSLSVATGTGTLSGTTTGTILANQSSVTINGIIYSKAESGVSLTATRASGDTGISAGTSGTFTVGTGPSITTQPAAQTACSGSPATFTVATPAGMAYQWQLGTGGSFSDIIGANSSSYTTPATTIADNGKQYHVVVSSPCGSPLTSSAATLIVNPSPTLSLTKTDVSCSGGNDGAVTATFSSGTSPYQINIDAGAFSTQVSPFTFTGLSAGSHTVIVQGGNGCTATNSIAVNQPAVVTFTTAHVNVTCNGGNNGSITVTASGGSGSYSYSDNNGASYQPSSSFSGLTAGTYNVVVKDSNGCLSTASAVTVTQPTAVTFTSTHGNVTCNGGNNGNITVSASGGSGSYTYSDNNGASYQSSSTFNNLAAGTYNVVVKDSSGCLSTAGAVTVTQPAATVTFTTVQVNVSCNGGNNGNITVSASGGSGSYTYSDNNGASYQSSSAFNNLAAGTYNVVVKDSVGCLSTAGAVTITQPTALTASAGAPQTICAGSSVAIGGSPTASGGTPGSGYTYLWSPSTGLNSATAANPSASPTANTTYTVTVTDANNCTKTSSTTITVNTPPQLTLNPANETVCTGSPATFSVAATGTSLTYQWKKNGVNLSNGGSISGATSATLTINSATAADAASSPGYSCVVSGGGICGTTSVPSGAATLIVNPLPANCSITGSDSVGTNSSGNIYSGPAGMSAYIWTATGGTITAGAASQNVTVTAGAGASMTLTLTISDANGCSSTCSKTVALLAPFSPTLLGTAVDTSTVTTLATTASVLTGNTIFVTVAADPGAYNASVADAGLNTYAKDADINNGSGVRTLVFSAPVNTALSSGSITVTFTDTGTGTPFNKAATFFSINDLVSPPKDQSATLTGNSSSASAGPTSMTAQPDEWLIGVVGHAERTASFTPGTGYTSVTSGGQTGGGVATGGQSQGNGVLLFTESEMVTATGAYSATASTSANKSAQWAAAIVSYKKKLPTVTSIATADANPTSAGTVHFTVTFSENVFNVVASDFILTGTFAPASSITSLSGSGSTYTVTADSGASTGTGSLGLNLVDNDSIIDIDNTPLGGTGAGNGNFTGATYTVNRSIITTTTVGSSVSPSTYGQGVTFTANVTSGSGTPTGTVQFIVDGSNFGSPATLSGGTATSSSISTLAAGTHTVTADYTATGIFVGGSGTLTGGQVVNTATLTITANSTSKTYGQTVSFAGTEFTPVGLVNGDTVTSVTLTSAGAGASAAVSGLPFAIVPSTAAGSGLGNYSISYINGALTVNRLAVSLTGTRAYDGTTTAAAGILSVGNKIGGDDVTVTSGSGTLAGANVGSQLITSFGSLALGGTTAGNYSFVGGSGSVTISAHALTIKANDRSKIYGQTVTFAGTEFTPTGLQNGETVGSVTLTSPGAAATATVAGSPYTITASAATGGTFTAGNYAISYATGSLTVTAADTATVVVSSQNPSCFGNSVTFTATVTDNSPSSTGTPTGTVTFKDGAATLGTGTLNGSGVAGLTTSSLAAASHSITAAYATDGNFSASASGALSQTVNPTSVGGTATATASTVCYNTSTTITLSGNTGTIQWQASPDNVTFTNIPGETALTLTTASLTNTYYFRAQVTSGVCSAASSSVATVSIDSTPPTLTCPAPVTVQCASAVPPHATDYASFVAQGGTASDGCGAVTVVWVSDVISAQSCANRHSITRTYKGTDIASNSSTCTQTITVDDETAPVITSFPADTTVSCASAVPAADDSLVSAMDNCAGSVTITHDTDVITPGSCANRYTITRTYHAADVCGNVTSQYQTIKVDDETAPTVTKGSIAACYKSLAAADAAAQAATTGTGACSETLTFSVSDNGQTCPATITVTATDPCGNSASVTYTATVLTTAPALSGCPAPTVLVNCAANIPTAATVTATDACGTRLPVNFNETQSNPGGCTNVITRTWTTTDCAGNSSSCMQVVTLHTDELPTVAKGPINSCYKSLADADAAAKTATTGTGGCGETLTFSVSDDGHTCPATITVTGTDPCGNSATVTYTATVLTTPPVLSGCPDPTVLVHCVANIPTAATVTAKDACGTSLTVNLSETQSNAGGCTNVITRTWTTTDCAGNSSSCIQVVTLHTDNLPTVAKGSINSCYKSLADADAAAKAATTGTGACSGTLTFSVSDNGQSCPATITVTGTDACGNSASVTYMATVLAAPPTLSGCPDPTVLVHCVANIPTAATVTAKDACNTGLTVNFSETQSNAGGCTNVITRTWTTTDCAGNSSSCMQIVTLHTDELPTVAQGAINSCYKTLADADAAAKAATTGTGACSGTLTFSVSDNGQSCPATITVTGTDACGNSASVTYMATVLTAPPTLSGCPDLTVLEHCVANIPTAATVTAKDACNTGLTVNFSETQSNPGGCTNVITRAWTTTDCAGNSSSCMQVVTLHTDNLPTVNKGTINSCYKSLADADAAAKAATTGSGACSETLSLSVSDNGQTCPATITVTGTDTCGNSASVTYMATVLTTAPVLSGCPDPTVLVHCVANIPTAATVTAKDACNTGLTVNFSETQSNPGGCTNVITRTWTTTDCAGNSSSCMQVVTLHTDELPTAAQGAINSCYKTLADADAAAKAATTGTGACSGTLTFSVSDNGQSCPATITVTGTDACGNSASVTYMATVLTAPPTLSGCPAPTGSYECYSDVPSAPTVTAKDACGTTLSVAETETQSNSGSSCNNTITRTWTTTDCVGNVSRCTQIITVSVALPTISPPANLVISTGGACTAVTLTCAELGTPIVSDNCGVATVSCNAPATFPVGVTTVTWTAADACGNSATCQQKVTVTTDKSISANFNGTPIAAGNTLWFNAVLKPTLPKNVSGPVTIHFFNQTITSSKFKLAVPDATVILQPGVCATTTCDGSGNWTTTAPQSGLAGNLFLSGVAYTLPSALSGGLHPVTWSGTFTTDTPGVTLQWQWAAAVYTLLGGACNTVKSTDDTKGDCNYMSSDHAGTPEGFKSYVIGGAMGGGGSNWTGGLSSTEAVAPCQ